MKRSKTLLSFKYATKKNLKRQILENENDLITYDKLLEYLRDTFNISSGNILGLHSTNLKEFLTNNYELIKEYIEFYNITTDFNINYYLTEVDLYTKIDKDIIRKAIRNWMDFKNLSNIPIEPKYISSVIKVEHVLKTDDNELINADNIPAATSPLNPTGKRN